MSIYVFIHDGYADWEIGYLLPEFVMEKRSVVTVALTTAPVRSMGSLRVTPDMALDQVDLTQAEALILPGGEHWKEFANADLAALAQRVYRSGLTVAAICDATGFLAQHGLLDTAKHTSNSLDFLRERAPTYQGAEHYVGGLATRDGNLITASGFGAVEFTVAVMEAMTMYSAKDRSQWFNAYKHGVWE